MKVIDLINNSKGTDFSFEILPPLKGTGIEKLYQTIDKMCIRDSYYFLFLQVLRCFSSLR